MKILILSFYYEPDLCAGSFRCTALVNQLQSLIDVNTQIEVITTLPNRYSSFNATAPEFEQQESLIIHRVALPSHKSGMVDQAKAFTYFAIKTTQLVKHTHFDLVFATSSRLMTAVLGSWLARKKKACLYLDIRDIFVDTLHDILPKKIAIFASPFFSILERWSFQKAQRINLVSKGFQCYFDQYYPAANLCWFTNGVDPEFISTVKKSIKQQSLEKPLTILYAGNMGEGQGLHLIVPYLAKALEGQACFKMIGDGGRRQSLERALLEAGCQNVELLAPMPRYELIDAYQTADILFLHLNDYPAFSKVLPSKIFEYAAMGKPILAGVAGYAAEFLLTEVSNVAVFPPCDIAEALSKLVMLQLGVSIRIDFIEKYSRHVIMKKMSKDLLSFMHA